GKSADSCGQWRFELTPVKMWALGLRRGAGVLRSGGGLCGGRLLRGRGRRSGGAVLLKLLRALHGGFVRTGDLTLHVVFGLVELIDRLAEAASQLRKALGSEEEQDDQQDNNHAGSAEVGNAR